MTWSTVCDASTSDVIVFKTTREIYKKQMHFMINLRVGTKLG